MTEGKEKSNQKIVTTPRPKIKPAPQTAPKVETKPIDNADRLINILSKMNDKLDILINNSMTNSQPKILLSEIKLSELKALRELANEAVMKNKYPGGDQGLMNECSTLAYKIDEELRNRLKMYQ